MGPSCLVQEPGQATQSACRVLGWPQHMQASGWAAVPRARSTCASSASAVHSHTAHLHFAVGGGQRGVLPAHKEAYLDVHLLLSLQTAQHSTAQGQWAAGASGSGNTIKAQHKGNEQLSWGMEQLPAEQLLGALGHALRRISERPPRWPAAQPHPSQPQPPRRLALPTGVHLRKGAEVCLRARSHREHGTPQT